MGHYLFPKKGPEDDVTDSGRDGRNRDGGGRADGESGSGKRVDRETEESRGSGVAE